MKKNSMQLTLFLTNSCNLDCVYCYQHFKNSETMSFDCAISWIEKCLNDSKKEFVNIYLFGGEPLLQFDLIKEICEWTWQRFWNTQYKFVIQTNGTLLDSKKKDWLCSNKDRITLCLSLDGNREAHNKNRNNSFEQIDIDFFLKTWTQPQVKMTISKTNLSFLKDSVVWLHELGFAFSGCNLALGEGLFDEKFFLSLEIQLKLLADYYIANPSVKMSQILNVPIWRLVSCEKQENVRCHIKTEKLIVVNTDGSTSPCSFFSHISLDEIHRSKLNEELDELNVEKLYCYNNCKYFNVCDICFAENYSETGDIYTPSKCRCKLMKTRITASMYVWANRIADKLEENVIQEDLNTIKSILHYYECLQNENNMNPFVLSKTTMNRLNDILSNVRCC